MQKYDKYKKHYQKDQQAIESFDKLHRKKLHDNSIYENEYKSLCDVFNKNLDETRKEWFFLKWTKK